ncbi:MAG: helix-turn-helix transcriptional regulator [Gammaproteobacteria bacterium]
MDTSTPTDAAEALSIGDADFLLKLGTRVRQIRAQRGMSRRLLAQSADVSERYLAQLETGKGNISVLLLRQIAGAMGVRVDALMDLESELPAVYDSIHERIRQMTAAEMQSLHAHLFKDADQARNKGKRIALIGLRGAGKSTVGQRIANQLGIPFKELAQTIEAAAGMSLTEIFSLGGQTSYRKFEQQAIETLLSEFNEGVLAVGGSVVADTSIFERLLQSFTTIWLRAEPEEHMERVLAQGDNRPMAGNRHAMDELRRILIEREPLYRRADFIVDTSSRGIEDICEEVLTLDVFK